MQQSLNAAGATAEQRTTIDDLCARLGLPSEAGRIATAAEAEAAINELRHLQKRLCWRS